MLKVIQSGTNKHDNFNSNDSNNSNNSMFQSIVQALSNHIFGDLFWFFFLFFSFILFSLFFFFFLCLVVQGSVKQALNPKAKRKKEH